VLPLNHRAHLDGTAHGGRGDAGRQLDGGIEIICSTNGPSVVSVRPSCTRTVVAVSGGARPRPAVTPGFSLIFWYAA
jgi:hypothetical protein